MLPTAVMALGVEERRRRRDGRLLVSLGSLRGAEVIATAGPHGRAPVAALGARDVIDYHEQDWPDQVLAITDGTGVFAALNATPAGAGDAIRAVRDGGRLATIRRHSGAAHRLGDRGSHHRAACG
jgi:NADPH:quinone reductase-like Zn-dependent oxidoreductase